MKDEARQYATEDQEMRDNVVKSNKADIQIFQTEIQLKEFGDTLPTERKKSLKSGVFYRLCKCIDIS